MKFQPTPPREKIFAFQKVLKVIVSCLLGVIGCWHAYQAYLAFFIPTHVELYEGLTSVCMAFLFFGLAIFLYRNRANNTQRYDDIPGYGP